MANIKSSAKRDEKSKELRAKNRADKTELKTMMKKFDAAVAEGDKDAAVSAYKVAQRGAQEVFHDREAQRAGEVKNSNHKDAWICVLFAFSGKKRELYEKVPAFPLARRSFPGLPFSPRGGIMILFRSLRFS